MAYCSPALRYAYNNHIAVVVNPIIIKTLRARYRRFPAPLSFLGTIPT